MGINKDGKIGVAELMKFHADSIHKFDGVDSTDSDMLFSEVDKDQDSKISQHEFVSHFLPPFEGEESGGMPTDTNDALKEIEIAKFKGSDSNGDGYIDKAELFKAL